MDRSAVCSGPSTARYRRQAPIATPRREPGSCRSSHSCPRCEAAPSLARTLETGLATTPQSHSAYPRDRHPARTILPRTLVPREAAPAPEVGQPLRRKVALVLDPQPLVGHVRPPGRREQENHHVGVTPPHVERGRETVDLRHVQVEQ